MYAHDFQFGNKKRKQKKNIEGREKQNRTKQKQKREVGIRA